MRDAELTHLIIGVANDIRRNLGPGLLEAVYEECLAKECTLRNIPFAWHYEERDNAETESGEEIRREAGA